MRKRVIFLLLLATSIFLPVFAQPIVSDPTQEEEKEQSSTEEKAVEDMVLTSTQPALSPAENE